LPCDDRPTDGAVEPPTVTFDRAGRVWADVGPGATFPIRRWDGKSVSVLKSLAARPLLDDSEGRVWFVTATFSRGEPGKPNYIGEHFAVSVLDAHDRPGEPYRHPVPIHSPIIQQGPDRFWLVAADGLLCLRVENRDGKCRVLLDKQYPRIVPPGFVNWLWIDAQGGLWMTSRGGSGLYRIQLPALDDKK